VATAITSEVVRELCLATARSLVNVARVTDKQPTSPPSRLVFPKYQAGREKVRISEQEARQTLCSIIAADKREIYYSVETPTVKKYRFGGPTPRLDPSGQSARTDVSLFTLQNQELLQAVNVEFKAHHVVPSHISKDFLKLLCEPVPGVFFHAFEATNRGTLPALSDKYAAALASVCTDAQPNSDWFLLFAVCLMSPQKQIFTRLLKQDEFENRQRLSDFSSFFGPIQRPNWAQTPL